MAYGSWWPRALALGLLAFIAGLPLRRAGEALWARVVAGPVPAFFGCATATRC